MTAAGSHGSKVRRSRSGRKAGSRTTRIAAVVAAGWRLVGLGPRILRVETAAMALAAVCSGQSAVDS